MPEMNRALGKEHFAQIIAIVLTVSFCAKGQKVGGIHFIAFLIFRTEQKLILQRSFEVPI